MTAPQVSIKDRPPESLAVLFRIIGRSSWDDLQGWHRALPGSRIEHVRDGIYVLVVEPGSAGELIK